jgi:hypothetical protein
MPPRKSPVETSLHEALHVVACRLEGLDIADVTDGDDRALTILVESQRFTSEAIMAPEIYMTIYNIDFKEESVSSDRNALAECYRPEDLFRVQQHATNYLREVFLCPWVCAAISILSARLHDELQEHRAMSGPAIHKLIDPMLKHSRYADGLRENLSG